MNPKRTMRRAVLSRLFEHLQEKYGFDWSREVFIAEDPEEPASAHQVEAALAFKSDAQLEEFCSALHRLEQGTYGTCLTCKRPISQDILDADPTARLCPSCARSYAHAQADAQPAFPLSEGRTFLGIPGVPER